MAELRALYVGLGLREVTTLLNRGNVVCRVEGKKAKDLGARIEATFLARFGFAAGVVNRTPEQTARNDVYIKFRV